ncbi:MAG TPA: hypothetical protein PLI09_19680 [Candidatus Hydrogenedentes bacterium]|nr:hypothetical protein [Candidatus Hydrogenedentota bacterium]
MHWKKILHNQGMALMEMMLAVGIFAVVVGVTATALSSFYVNMDSQQQRMIAVQSCQSVLGAIREKRAEYVDQNDLMDRAGFLNWIAEKGQEQWSEYLTSPSNGGLTNHQLTVDCRNAAGSPATAADSPIEVYATASWLDRAGRPMRIQLATILADR